MDGEDSNMDVKLSGDFNAHIPSPSTTPPRKLKNLHGHSSRICKDDHAKRLLHEHRCRLTRILRRLVDDHNWEDASNAFSVLVKLTLRDSHGWTMMDLRKNFVAASQILLRKNGDSVNPSRIRELCDVWISKLKGKKTRVREIYLVQLELALFFLTHGKTAEAHQITKFLLQKREIASHPNLHLVHGMALFEMWYSGLPKEMLLIESGLPSMSEHEEFCNGNVGQVDVVNRNNHSSSRQLNLEASRSSNSCSSIDNYKDAQMEVDHLQKKSCEDFPSGSFAANESAKVKEEINIPSSDFGCASIFSCHGVDIRLLPIRLNYISGSLEEKINRHRELLDENYFEAVRHLHDALHSEPPLMAALIPYVQILLLGDQVEEALRGLKFFCQHSNSALCFRLRVALLEVFSKSQQLEICNCHENILKKDSTCYSSLERLISISKNGNYGKRSLLEMIAMHLDAAPGNCDAWGELASCLLGIQTANITEYDRDQVSSNQASMPHPSSFGRSIDFLKQEDKRSWKLRSYWWSKHHFSKSRYIMETQTGDWQLLTCKAASASQLYGPNFEYVCDVHKCLVEKEDHTNIAFLQKHWHNSLKLYHILSRTHQV